ncbi:unnamed protein product, partial [Pelagomonas calceolata]
AAAARGLALSLCYVMHADWFNDVCDVDVDAKNKPERPLPSGACSRAQGLLVAAFYGCLGLGVTRTPPEPALRRAYAAAFAAMGAAAFLYSDDRLPTRRLARRAPLGRALAFCGIYAAFDALMYVEACDALGLAPAPFAANPLFGAFLWAAAATVPWNLALLVAKDLGDVPGDAAAGLRTLPAALPDDRSAGCLVLALPGPEWKYRVDLREPPRHAIEQTRSRGQRRVDGGSDAWVGQAVLMCVHEMDNWLLGVNKAWTATTPEGGFRAPSKFGGLGGANFPSSREEVVSFVAFAERLWDLDTPKFAGSFQNQGKRLLKYLPARLYEIDKVVAALRAARSWKDACKAVLTLSGVGDYVGGQALCTFFFGVCEGDVSRFAPNLDATTMKSFCLCGPGPEGVVKKMWGGVQLGKSEAVKRLAWLAENSEAQFQALGLRFPFQRDADGARKRLTAVDLEHALCYFSRYLSAHDSLKAAGARIVYDKLAGPIARDECPRPSIKWFAKLKEKTAAERCDKWLADAEAGFQEAFTS